MPVCPASCLDGHARVSLSLCGRRRQDVNTARWPSRYLANLGSQESSGEAARTGGGGRRPLEFLKYLNIATVVRPLPQFDSWDKPLRVALVYFASLFIRTCDSAHLPRDSGNGTHFSLPQVYAYQIVRLGLVRL